MGHRVRHQLLADQLVPAVDADIVLVATGRNDQPLLRLAVLAHLRPAPFQHLARIGVFLAKLRRPVFPLLRNLPLFEGLFLLLRQALLWRIDDAGN